MSANTDHIIDGFVGIRKKKKLSQAAVAKKADLHQAAVGRIENKSTNPQLDTMVKLLNTMGYTLAIVPVNGSYDNPLILDILTDMETLDAANIRRLKAYVDVLNELEKRERLDALEKLRELTKDLDLDELDGSYKKILYEELDRRYGPL